MLTKTQAGVVADHSLSVLGPAVLAVGALSTIFRAVLVRLKLQAFLFEGPTDAQSREGYQTVPPPA